MRGKDDILIRFFQSVQNALKYRPKYIELGDPNSVADVHTDEQSPQ